MNNLSIKLKVTEDDIKRIDKKKDPEEKLEEVLKMMKEQIEYLNTEVPNQKDIIEHAKISPNKFIFNTEDSFRKYCLKDNYEGFGNVMHLKRGDVNKVDLTDTDAGYES